MEIAQLREFFWWCGVVNVGLMALSLIICAGLGDVVYRTHSKWFPMPRETFNVVMYSFIGVYKIFVIMFNIVPYVALSIMA